MKKVDDSFRDKISDLITASGLTISEFALEKDFIVMDVLRAISKMRHDKFDLVFCGGTCLSKAYGLLERISEDVDIKVVPKSGVELSKGQQRTAVRSLKVEINSVLVGVGFDAADIAVSARDGNSYIIFDAEYLTHFEFDSTMRAKMKLELNLTALSLPSSKRAMGLLFNQFAGIGDDDKIEMPCIDIREALAEKLVAFPRRLALHLTNPEKHQFDQALVRHLFDVHQIVVNNPGIDDPSVLKPLIEKVMNKDAKDFARQFSKFLSDPVGQLTSAMNVAATSPAYADMYADFVRVMVYGPNSPAFVDALRSFYQALNASLPPATLNFKQYEEAEGLAS